MAVCEFYKGKNLFITGGTGFVGICLIDKILRTLTDVGKIYLLMRPKKGKEITDRLEEITKNAIFEKLLETNSSDVFNKLIPIAGDVGEENLGLSASDRKILTEEVNVVIHSAATLDFQQNLKPTVTINLLGTRRVMELCKEMKKLLAMVHVSSAYVNSYQLHCEEILYPAPKDAEKVITLATTLSDAALNALEKSLIENHPNTYTFTKHLAEHEVAKCSSLFPCAIVRPSMITAAWKEPVPGWTISKNGPQGFIMGASKGVIRRLPVAKHLISDFIPVDVVVSELLVAAYKSAKDKEPLSIYHCTSSTCNPFRWEMIITEINSYLALYPLKSAIWYPNIKFSPSIFMFKLSAIYAHWIPGFFLDLLTRILGGRPILMRLHSNVNESVERLRIFIFSEWTFDNKNTQQLYKSLSEDDKDKFRLDISTLDWRNYFKALALGVRRYLHKEPLSNLGEAKSKLFMFKILQILLKLFVLSGMWYLVSLIFGTGMLQIGWIVPILYIFLSIL